MAGPPVSPFRRIARCSSPHPGLWAALTLPLHPPQGQRSDYYHRRALLLGVPSQNSTVVFFLIEQRVLVTRGRRSGLRVLQRRYCQPGVHAALCIAGWR